MNLKTTLVAGVALIASVSAHAANYQGTVVNVSIRNGVAAWVYFGNGGYDGPASTCGSRVYNFDPTTPFGKAMLSVALSAKVTGGLVYAVGTGVCGGDPNGGLSEGLAGLDLKD